MNWGDSVVTKPLLLYVEDEPLIAMAIIDLLEEAGFDVKHALDGPSAIALLDEDPGRYAALVTDVRLPKGINGWQIGHHARTVRPHIPVVYVSGDSGAEWSAEGVPDSMMLQKPFANAQLIAAIAQVINEAGMD
jgi:CheY-like chemotaxis protein